jgi:hypothetical protein
MTVNGRRASASAGGVNVFQACVREVVVRSTPPTVPDDVLATVPQEPDIRSFTMYRYVIFAAAAVATVAAARYLGQEISLIFDTAANDLFYGR